MDAIDNINRLLKERGMSGAELSRSLGLSNAVYSQWNTKKTRPSPKTVKRIADYFGVSVEFLYSSEENTDAVVQEISTLQANLAFAAEKDHLTKADKRSLKKAADSVSMDALSALSIKAQEAEKKAPTPEGAEADPDTAAIHAFIDGADDAELQEIRNYIEFIKSKRGK